MPQVYGQVTVSWNANSEADLAGYRIYYGPSSVNLSATPITVGLVTTFTITSFEIYGTLFFAMTAFDTSNNESGFSTPVVSIAVAPKIMPMIWP